MPKVSPNTERPSSPSRPARLKGAAHSGTLRRNQACHQCRRRKLKCDANRPCSTCVRSHAHALAHPPAGQAPLPPYPECTFDEAVTESEVVYDAPKNRYERLENRIDELEALLFQKERAAASDIPFDIPADLSVPSSSTSALLSRNGPLEQSFFDERAAQSSPSAHYLISAPLLGNASETNHEEKGILGISLTANSLSPIHSASPIYGLDIVWPNWPPNLPHLDLLRHLVEVFLVFHPHANHLLHASSFVTCLSLPPSHPKFPAAPVLHAICAMGSLYTAAVSSPPLPDFDAVEPDEIFSQRSRIKEKRPDSFAEQQAECARETASRQEALGENLFQVLQANIILSWFYWYHARWVELFCSSAHCLRVAVPLGLNTCPPFQAITSGIRPASLLSPARTVIEDEMRRNTFWLAYAVERQPGCSNGWANSLDDQDVSQLLPVRRDDYQQGVLVTPNDRQWAHYQDVLLFHPESQADSFILYIKGTILISQVKSFNVRFRARHFAGDPSMASLDDEHGTNMSGRVDPRNSPAFIRLDHIASSFRASFPNHLKSPISDNVLDPHLYTATLMPYVATILLHDPFADVHQGCISAVKILASARSILELIYHLWSTSYDITLVDSFCVLSWFSGGRVLVRFLQAALDKNKQDQTTILKLELEAFRSAIAKCGERIPLAYRYAKMLENLIWQSSLSQAMNPISSCADADADS